MMNKEVEKWLKKLEKKNPVLFASEKGSWGNGRDWIKYTIIFNDCGKVKIGTIRNNANIRYGVNVYGVLKPPYSPVSLWQKSSGAVDEIEYDYMLSYAKGDSLLGKFDVSLLNEITS